MRCSKCFAENAPNSIFCEMCGNKLSAPAPTASSVSNFGFMAAPADLDAPLPPTPMSAPAPAPAPDYDDASFTTETIAFDRDVPAYTPAEPAYEAPVYESPAPAYEAPVYEAPAPAYEAPVPAYEPPVYEAPAPAYEPPVYETPAPAYEPPVYEAPAPAYEPPVHESPVPAYEASLYEATASAYEMPSRSYDAPSYDEPTSGYGAPTPSYDAPTYERPVSGYATPAYSAPTPPHEPTTPAAGARRTSSYRSSGPSINRKPPLPAALVAVVAAISTLALFFNIFTTLSSYGSWGSYAAIISMLPREVTREMSDFLSAGVSFMTAITLFGYLFDLGLVIGMWLVFGGSCGKTVRPIFSGGLTTIKVLRIFSAIGSILVASLVAIACLLSAIPMIATVSADYIWLPIVMIVAGIGYLVFVIFYHISIFRTLNNIRHGATTGEYRSASGFLIFCLLGTALLNLVSMVIIVLTALYAFPLGQMISFFFSFVIPLLEGISLCIYNARRNR